MTTPIMKPLKAFRVGEPIPTINKTIIVPEADVMNDPKSLERVKILKEVRDLYDDRVEEIPLYSPPPYTPKSARPTFAELYGSKTAGAPQLRKPKKIPLPRSSYRTTHDHVARTTTLIQRVEDTEIKRFPAVPGILSLRQALLANGVFSPKRPLFRS